MRARWEGSHELCPSDDAADVTRAGRNPQPRCCIAAVVATNPTERSPTTAEVQRAQLPPHPALLAQTSTASPKPPLNAVLAAKPASSELGQ